jgi:hypothetical protein
MSKAPKVWSFMRTSVNTAHPWRRNLRYESPLAQTDHYSTTTPKSAMQLQAWRKWVFPVAFVTGAALYRANYKCAVDKFLNAPGAFVVDENGLPLPLPPATFLGKSLIPTSLQPMVGTAPLTSKSIAFYQAKAAKSVAENSL